MAAPLCRYSEVAFACSREAQEEQRQKAWQHCQRKREGRESEMEEREREVNMRRERVKEREREREREREVIPYLHVHVIGSPISVITQLSFICNSTNNKHTI
jgi:sortase (surface protein transpeptidase)